MTYRTVIMFNTFEYPELWKLITVRGTKGEYAPLRPMYLILPVVPNLARSHVTIRR